MNGVRASDSEKGVAVVLEKSKSALILVCLPFFEPLIFSFLPSAMQEAVDWVKSLPNQGEEEALVTGNFSFRRVEVRVDLLSYLIRDTTLVANLCLWRAEISSSGLAEVFAAAMGVGSLRVLQLKQVHFDETAFAALVTLIKHSRYITEYVLEGDKIGDADVAAICDALAERSAIERFLLPYNVVGPEGARSLGRFLKSNGSDSLYTLNLRLCPVGDEGVISLVDGLESNNSLRELILDGCAISDDGAVALASLFANGSYLQKLYLMSNNITEIGVKALANSLQHNRSLQLLSLVWNPGVCEEGVKDVFQDALKKNVTLKVLGGIQSPTIHSLFVRNREQIPAAVRSAALLLIGSRRWIDIEGMGDFAVLPKDVVRLIAQTVWATRRDPIWIQALQ